MLVVYVAFSEGMRNHISSQVSVEVIAVAVLATALVVVMLIVTGALPRRLGFDRADTIAIQFCGSKKSLAAGLPMATVLFAGSTVGLIVLPLMIFHQVQLILCSMLASRYAKTPDPDSSSPLLTAKGTFRRRLVRTAGNQRTGTVARHLRSRTGSFRCPP